MPDKSDAVRKEPAGEQKDDMAAFEAACRVAKRLADSGKLRIRIVYPSRVDLRVGTEDLNAAVEQEKVDADQCRDLLDNEIAPLLASAISGDSSPLSMLLMRRSSDPATYPKTRETIIKKSKIVKDELATKRLRDRYLTKHTSKVNVLSGWHWEISAKEFDDREGDLKGLRSAMVRIHAHRRTGQYDDPSPELVPLGLMPRPVDAFSFECDLEEAEELRDAFASIAMQLGRTESQETKEEQE